MLNSLFKYFFISFKLLLATIIYSCLLFSYISYGIICFTIYPVIATLLFLKYQYIKSKDLNLLKETFNKYNIKEFKLSSTRGEIKITSINNCEILYLNFTRKAFKTPQFLLFTIRDKISVHSRNKESFDSFLLSSDIKQKQYPIALYNVLLNLKPIQAFNKLDLTLHFKDTQTKVTLTNKTFKDISNLWIDLCAALYLVPKFIINLEKQLELYCKSSFTFKDKK